MRISDWSSDVCSSDLHPGLERGVFSSFSRGVRKGFGMSNQMPAMSAMPICWDQATDPTELRLMVGGDIRAVVTRWSPRDRPDRTDWWAAEGLDGNCRVGLGLFDFPGQA